MTKAIGQIRTYLKYFEIQNIPINEHEEQDDGEESIANCFDKYITPYIHEIYPFRNTADETGAFNSPEAVKMQVFYRLAFSGYFPHKTLELFWKKLPSEDQWGYLNNHECFALAVKNNNLNAINLIYQTLHTRRPGEMAAKNCSFFNEVYDALFDFHTSLKEIIAHCLRIAIDFSLKSPEHFWKNTVYLSDSVIAGETISLLRQQQPVVLLDFFSAGYVSQAADKHHKNGNDMTAYHEFLKLHCKRHEDILSVSNFIKDKINHYYSLYCKKRRIAVGNLPDGLLNDIDDQLHSLANELFPPEKEKILQPPLKIDATSEHDIQKCYAKLKDLSKNSEYWKKRTRFSELPTNVARILSKLSSDPLKNNEQSLDLACQHAALVYANNDCWGTLYKFFKNRHEHTNAFYEILKDYSINKNAQKLLQNLESLSEIKPEEKFIPKL